MPAFLLTLTLHAQEGQVTFEQITKPITPQEIVSVVAFIAVVAAGVFLLIRRRTGAPPRMSLDD